MAKDMKKKENEMDIVQLKNMKIAELTNLAKDLKVEGISGLKKHDLIFRILQAKVEKDGFAYGEGVLEILEDGWAVVTKDGMLSAHFEHTVLVTEKEPEILTESYSAGLKR